MAIGPGAAIKMTIGEAARHLGKSQRQLRNLVKIGRLKGTKGAGRWVFDQADLPVSAAQLRNRELNAAELKAAVKDALGPHLRPPDRHAYGGSRIEPLPSCCMKGPEGGSPLPFDRRRPVPPPSLAP